MYLFLVHMYLLQVHVYLFLVHVYLLELDMRSKHFLPGSSGTSLTWHVSRFSLTGSLVTCGKKNSFSKKQGLNSNSPLAACLQEVNFKHVCVTQIWKAGLSQTMGKALTLMYPFSLGLNFTKPFF